MSDQDLIDKVLHILHQTDGQVSTLIIAKKLHVDHQKITGAIKSIVAQAATISPSFLKIESKESRLLELTTEGKIILENGSHEARIFRATFESKPDGINQLDLMQKLSDQSMAKVGFAKAMSNGWISLDKTTKRVLPKVEKVEDSVQDSIRKIALLSIKDQYEMSDHKEATLLNCIDSKTLAELKKRKLLVESVIKYMLVGKGPDFSLTIEKPETDLTTNLLLSGDWKDKKFKEYNFNSLGVSPERGHLHPLLKVREQFRQIFLEMGFAEMPTNNYVDSSFWNFDTLVVPQAHPARDSQDTFFISNPKIGHPITDRELVERVREAHLGTEDGNWPKGYRYSWSENESSLNVLRTHTTAVTARMLYKIANEHKANQKNSSTNENDIVAFKPAKLFSIDRVFRNETLDATHLAEFNQVEGVVLDEGLTLGDLMGVLRAFFEKLGIGQLRFKPAYNPYTEPSMEVFSYHSGLKKWVEIGNSGVFRPEMLQALGLPETVTAIAWGLSLERPTMIKYKIDNIRELVGHKVNIQMVQDSTLCLF